MFLSLLIYSIPLLLTGAVVELYNVFNSFQVNTALFSALFFIIVSYLSKIRNQNSIQALVLGHIYFLVFDAVQGTPLGTSNFAFAIVSIFYSKLYAMYKQNISLLYLIMLCFTFFAIQNVLIYFIVGNFLTDLFIGQIVISMSIVAILSFFFGEKSTATLKNQ